MGMGMEFEAIGGGAIRGLGAICGSKMLKLVFRGALGVPFCGSGGGPSPNSAIRDMYSSSILALSPGRGGPPWPGRLERQSRAM